MKGRTSILLDLDDTLYVCAPAEAAAAAAVEHAVARALDLAPAAVSVAWKAARAAVKARIDLRGSSHSRLLYLAELVHAVGRPGALTYVRSWERTYWTAFLEAAQLRPRVKPFLASIRKAGGKIAIVSDLTLEVQLWKLETLGLLPLIDALAVSEEVAFDKPHDAIFRLALARLGTMAEQCVMVGDRDDRDGEGARRLGMPYVAIDDGDETGAGFDTILAQLGIEAA